MTDEWTTARGSSVSVKGTVLRINGRDFDLSETGFSYVSIQPNEGDQWFVRVGFAGGVGANAGRYSTVEEAASLAAAISMAAQRAKEAPTDAR